MGHHTNNAPDYTPTPEQIRVNCEAIQKGWNKTQEAGRRVVKGSPYELTPVAERVLGLNHGVGLGSI